MKIKPLRRDILAYLKARGLSSKWDKTRLMFENNYHHPSLHKELLEPHWRGIYSFRIDKKYRAIYFIINNEAEVFKVTNHYKK